MGRSPVKPQSTEEILELINGDLVLAVLGTAMELGVFWLLADEPLSTRQLIGAWTSR